MSTPQNAMFLCVLVINTLITNSLPPLSFTKRGTFDYMNIQIGPWVYAWLILWLLCYLALKMSLALSLTSSSLCCTEIMSVYGKEKLSHRLRLCRVKVFVILWDTKVDVNDCYIRHQGVVTAKLWINKLYYGQKLLDAGECPLLSKGPNWPDTLISSELVPRPDVLQHDSFLSITFCHFSFPKAYLLYCRPTRPLQLLKLSSYC